MRFKFNPQVELCFSPSHLKLTNEYYAKYEAISSILDEVPEILNLVHQDLKKPLKYASQRVSDGSRYKFTSDNVLRILLCQIIEGDSLRGIVVRIDDSNYLRRFVRLYHGPMMDFTTLDKLKNCIGPETWRKINRLLAKHAVNNELIGGEELRIDTTAVETNIHWPTDSALLWDVYRVLARLIDQAREIDPGVVGTKRLHIRRAKRLRVKIARQGRGKGTSAKKLKPLYEPLIDMVEGILIWSKSVAGSLENSSQRGRYGLLDGLLAEALADEMEHYAGLGLRVVDQARRRVLWGEVVPNDEKIFSIFEAHTELLKRGKVARPIEFGHMIQIQQVRDKFITDYCVFDKKPNEYQLLDSALRSHKMLFGEYPNCLAADKGYYENMKALKRLEKKVDIVSIAKKGKRSTEETQRETDPLFRHAQRFRAGIEGTISFLKRILGLQRCFNKGWPHFVATVGATVFAHNLLLLARC